jgi:hypothetical protein
MSGRGDVADMNSTPIGKLPPPSIPLPSVDSSTTNGGESYQEILKNMELHRTMQSEQIAAPRLAASSSQMQQLQQMQMQQMQMQQMPQMPPPKKALPPPQKVKRPAASKKKSSKIDLRALRPALVVAAIVFVVLSRGAPMIATRLPFSVDAITGKFTISGLIIISMLSGGMYLGINELIKRFVSDRIDQEDDD